MKASISINPCSGRQGNALRLSLSAQRMAAAQGAALSVKMIKDPVHGLEVARAAVSARAERVLCAGGDGTLNAVATGLIETWPCNR